MTVECFDKICLTNNNVEKAIIDAIDDIKKEMDFEKNAELISRISQENILRKINSNWNIFLQMCELAEVSVSTKEAKSYIYKSLINYYSSIGLSSKVIEYSIKYEKLALDPIDNYEVFNMAAFSLYETGFYDKAIKYILMSQSAFDSPEVDEVFKVISYNNLVYCYDAVGNINLIQVAYYKFKNGIEDLKDEKKKKNMKLLFKMCSFFVKLKTSDTLSNKSIVSDDILENYLEYLEEIESLKNLDVMESEDVHTQFIDYIISKKDYVLATKVCKKLLKLNKISGSRKQIYRRLILLYEKLGDSVSKQEYFDTVLDYNKILESYNDRFDNIMHELVNEQFRISEMEEKYIMMKNDYQIDGLTSCLNRKAFDSDLELIEASSSSGTVVFFDLDYLKSINDTYGHKCGDVYLRYFSYLTSNIMSQDCKFYRYGGDEFIIIMKNNADEAMKFVNKLKSAFMTPCKLIDKSIRLQFSYGIVEYGVGKIKISEAIKLADEKMYLNKRGKRRR